MIIKSAILPLILITTCIASVQVLQKQKTVAGPRQVAAVTAPQNEIRGMMVLQEDGRGHFMAVPGINGVQIESMVDTGASIIALTFEDAARIGLFPNASDFKVTLATANGSIAAAPVKLREVRLGGIRVNDVEAVVLPAGKLKVSLLGMSFLRRLSSFEVSKGALLLKE